MGMRFRLSGRRFTLPQALAITAVSAVLPGTAHLCAGQRRAGITLLAAFGALGTLSGVVAATHWQGVVELSHRPRTPLLVLIIAAAWVALLIRSYLLLRPPGMPAGAAAGGGAALAAICLLVTAPALTALGYGSHERAPVTAMLAGSAPDPALPRHAAGHHAAGAVPDSPGSAGPSGVVGPSASPRLGGLSGVSGLPGLPALSATAPAGPAPAKPHRTTVHRHAFAGVPFRPIQHFAASHHHSHKASTTPRSHPPRKPHPTH